MAIFEVVSSDTPNEGKDKINDNFVDLDGRINELNPDGIGWVFQAGPPDSADGFDGDMYFDTTNGIFYGPKAAGAWPAEGIEAGGGSDAIWNPVRAATTANITLSGAQTIDGVACVAGDRVLVMSQSTATQNGIYVVAAGAWSRATDANATADFLYGKLVFIGNEGDYNFNQIGVFNSFAPFTLGTDAVNFILAIAPATETQWGTARAATQTEVDAGDAAGTDYYVRPETLAAYSGIPKDSKDSVRVATTANITLSGAQTIDGVSVVAGNRVLVKNQTTGSQNGIYLCASGSWTRTTDADTSAKVTPQMFVRVEEGTANGSKEFYLSNTGSITLGTTALTFAQVSGGGHVIQDESTPLTARTNLNFTGAGVVATDDSGNDQTDVTIPGKHVVQDEGSSLTARTNLDFQGAGVTVTDNSGSDKTIVTVPAGGPTGDPAYSTTSASFTQPSVASTVSVSVDATAWMGVGQVVYVAGGGYYTVSSITSGTVVVLNNLGYTGNAAPAATVATAAKVSPGGLVGATGSSGYRTLLEVASDVTITGTSFADVTGLTFAVSSGTNYRFQAVIAYDASATTVGAAAAVNGPASPTILSYYIFLTGATGGPAHFQNNAYDDATRLQTASRTTNNLCLIQGMIRPSASGTFAIRFATEASGTITVKAGSTCEYW